MAEVWGIPMATHNTGSLINTIATVEWASSIRDFLACETVTGKGDWMDKVIISDKPPIQGGYITLNDKPGIGVELNPDVVRAHLAPGETWWG
jgi:L-alanine-DL-glutamate epimerase-like enolase superfamily enzyme